MPTEGQNKRQAKRAAEKKANLVVREQEIERTIAELRELWLSIPSQRLCQLVVNLTIADDDICPSVFYTSDIELRAAIRDMRKAKTAATIARILSENESLCLDENADTQQLLEALLAELS